MGTVLADWDNTLRGGFSLRAWLAFLGSRGDLAPRWTSQYQLAEEALLSGHTTYDAFLGQACRLYASAVATLDAPTVDAVADDFVATDREHLLPHTLPFLEMLEELDARVIVISGAPEIVLRAYVRALPIHQVVGLTSDGEGPPWPGSSEFKARAVSRLRLKPRDVEFAIGDTASDSPLFDVARHQIVVENEALAEHYPNALNLGPADPMQIATLLSWVRARW